MGYCFFLISSGSGVHFIGIFGIGAVTTLDQFGLEDSDLGSAASDFVLSKCKSLYLNLVPFLIKILRLLSHSYNLKPHVVLT